MFNLNLYSTQSVDANVVLKKWSTLDVRLSSYGCTREVGRAREKRVSGTRRGCLVVWIAPHGQESVSIAPIVWRKWLVFLILSSDGSVSPMDAARLREWAEGLVDRPDKKIKTKKCPKYLETAIFFLNISKFSKHRQMYQVLRVICYFCLSSTRNLFLLKFSGFAVGTSSVCLWPITV